MDKPKQTNSAAKKDTDTSSKKERRSAKVQEKQPPKMSTQLTEKELRKLEWQKKLAEEKPQADIKADGISKAELKQKRREQQEAQRLSKTVKLEPQKAATQDTKTTRPSSVKVALKQPSPPKKTESVKKSAIDTTKLQLVNHLYAAESLKKAEYETTIVNYKNVHPVFVRLGVQYATKKILGSNARCLALLVAVKNLIEDLQTPPKQEFCRYFQNVLESCINYLQYCRPFAVSMSNVLKYFKVNLRKVTKATTWTDDKKKHVLIDHIKTYITDEIGKAGEAISMKVNEKICDGDIILTYGCSSLIKKILLDAHKEGKQFQVIIVDGRPFLEGRQMLQRLVQIGIHCTYIQINGLSYVMSTVTKVLLGAHAILTNGYVMSRIGTAQVALVAKAYNKPVLVCCETYKFSERVQTDSFVYNELGDSSMLVDVDTLEETSPLVGARNDPNLMILNLLYDVTPPDLVTAVVTELAILPCTSVPVVLRIKPTEF